MTTMVARVDPPVSAGGSCAHCGKPRHPERSRRYGAQAAVVDPFCSRACCEAWHGIEGAGVDAEELDEFGAAA